MIPSVTPLRYPGSKTWLVGYFKKFLEYNNLEPEILAEPYAGSGAVAISLLKDGKIERAFLNEMDPLIVAFWKSILYHQEELIERIQSVEVNIANWNKFRKYLAPDASKKYPTIDLGFAFLFFNRTNFSGIVSGGPLGGQRQQSKYSISCRFKRGYLVDKVRKMGELGDKVKIYQSDGIKFMKKIQKTISDREVVYYVDPPYFKSGRDLYLKWFVEEDHVKLSEFLKSFKPPWFLSYDDSEFIKLLYKESKSQPVYADYQAWKYRKNVKELLFSNYVIPPMLPSTIEVYEYASSDT